MSAAKKFLFLLCFSFSSFVIGYSHMATSLSVATSWAPKKITIVGAGLHGSALAYYLTQKGHKDVTIIEKVSVASAASGKGGGFLARDWGSGPTVPIHKESFELHSELAIELGLESYRKIPVVSVEPGQRSKRTIDVCPWLDGEIGSSSMMDEDGGAQVDPMELCTKLMDAAIGMGAKLIIGTVEGIQTDNNNDSKNEESKKITGVVVDGNCIETDAVAVTMGPWASLAEDWFQIPIPITGIKSTSLVFEAPPQPIEPYALFCGEDHRFSTHLEVYPRKNGEIYICGLGGSEHVEPSRLKAGEYPPGEVFADTSRVTAASSAFRTMTHQLSTLQPKLSQACMRPCPPDGLPLMGKINHLKGAYISAGHNCWGILWAPSSGKAMAELMMFGKTNTLDLSPFSPHRFVRSSSKMKRGRHQGADSVGEQW